VLDAGAPAVDGIETCRRLRSFSDAYVILVTARHSAIERVLGLSAGADDYLTKPFYLSELISRIRRAQRRSD
jgi:DNA-binding response OmpR family regulator